MEHMIWVLLTVFLLIFALGLFIAGIFTVYFGSGKSRGIGGGLLAGGIILGILIVLFYSQDILFPGEDTVGGGLSLWHDIIYPGLIYLGAAILGALAAVGLFLLAIMKS
jgi:hypothetical protein